MKRISLMLKKMIFLYLYSHVNLIRHFVIAMDKDTLHSCINDPGRLAALKTVALLDTPAEEAFDRLSRLAVKFTKSPVALVSLVDRDRQFFKSVVGLPEPWITCRQTPLSHSFCKYNLVAGAPLAVPDARKHALFRDNPAIRELNVVAYLGIPLVTKDGHVIGSFCVIDARQRDWKISDIETLTELAAAVMTEIELRTEIAERKKTEAELGKLWGTVKNSPLSIIITDTGGIIEYTNPAFTDISGFSAEEVQGRNVRMLKSDVHEPGFFKNIWKIIGTGESWQGEICSVKKDGTLFWEQTNILPVRDDHGNLTHFVAMKEDITDKKEMAELKEDVARIMRHDLKQPLTGIITLPQVLRLKGGLSSEQMHIVRLIEETGIRMSDMIDLSLDMFKIETGEYRVRLQRVNAAALIFQVADQNCNLMEGKSLVCEISMNGSPLERADRVMVLSEDRLFFPLLSNLFINAVEASPKHDTIFIDICRRETGITITVRNRGAVPGPVRSRFFEKYQTHGKKNGTGLGTYSARLFATTLGYGIHMETRDDIDTTQVTLVLPLERIPDLAHPPGSG